MARSNITKEESNVLVAIGKLETQMDGMRGDIAAARSEIKEINTGITARLLNLESNAVSKIVVEVLDTRVVSLENSRVSYRAQLQTWGLVWGAVTFLGPIILAIYLNH